MKRIRRRRNPGGQIPAGYSVTWYRKGYRAGVLGQGGGDYVSAWKAAKGKPGTSATSGSRITAQESFYYGYSQAQGNVAAARKGNPRTVIPSRFVNARVRRLPGGRLHIEILGTRTAKRVRRRRSR